MTDALDDNSFSVSPLDKQRILDLEVGEDMEAESGQFKVFRYQYEYLLCFSFGERNDMIGLEDTNKLFYYLSELM